MSCSTPEWGQRSQEPSAVRRPEGKTLEGSQLLRPRMWPPAARAGRARWRRPGEASVTSPVLHAPTASQALGRDQMPEPRHQAYRNVSGGPS